MTPICIFLMGAFFVPFLTIVAHFVLQEEECFCKDCLYCLSLRFSILQDNMCVHVKI